MILWSTLSFEGRSIILLWILISYLSNVAVPSPQGDFLVVTFNLFVGRGIGPEITMPELLAMSFILEMTSFSLSISTLCSFILTLLMALKQKLGF